MPELLYNDNIYSCKDNETILDTFLRQGVDIAFSCRSGICQVCLLRATEGKIPEKSQRGLKQNLIEHNYFKACQCVPEGDMTLAPPRSADMLSRAVVVKKELLAPGICRLLLETATNLYYHPGQYINLRREDGEMRSYSLASVPTEDYFLELQIKKVENGLFSHWIFNCLNEDDEIEFQGANGDCYYTQNNSKQPILLIATGTGVAPLIGVARDALSSGHQEDIYLYHGSATQEGLYLDQQLNQLAQQYTNFHYQGCVDNINISDNTSNDTSGRANENAFKQHPELTHWQVFLSGQPEMVEQSIAMALNAGADKNNIHSDPFWSIEASDNTSKTTPDIQQERRRYPDPAPEIWQALDNGKLLTKILQDFYERVYTDPKLLSFFENSTKQRSIEKQYNFLYQLFTGEKVYFGDRPYNAHHWMVISNELFDYREDLLMACAEKHGVARTIIDKWRALEEFYRDDMVKDKPVSRFKFGKEIPMDGYEELTMDDGTLCDHCGAVVNIGETVRYHTRLGKIYCLKCMQGS